MSDNRLKKFHRKKCLPWSFQAVKDGSKTFEIRLNDCDYQVGDEVCLEEYEQEFYTGDQYIFEISFVTDFEQKDGYVVLGIKSEQLQTAQNRIDELERENTHINGSIVTQNKILDDYKEENQQLRAKLEVKTTTCPECGCKEYTKLVDLESVACDRCKQEWFFDIDYSEVIIKENQDLKAKLAPLAGIEDVAGFVNRANAMEKLLYQINDNLKNHKDDGTKQGLQLEVIKQHCERLFPTPKSDEDESAVDK